MVCGALHAAVVAAIEVARRAIAPWLLMSARAAGGHRWARTRGQDVMWGIADPVLMHCLPRVGAWVALRRLTPVIQACYDRFTFTYQQNRVVIPNVAWLRRLYDERSLQYSCPVSGTESPRRPLTVQLYIVIGTAVVPTTVHW